MKPPLSTASLCSKHLLQLQDLKMAIHPMPSFVLVYRLLQVSQSVEP